MNDFSNFLLNNQFSGKLKELFNLGLMLVDRVSFLLKDMILWIWDIFSRVFGSVLQFTIDLVNLVLGYI